MKRPLIIFQIVFCISCLLVSSPIHAQSALTKLQQLNQKSEALRYKNAKESARLAHLVLSSLHATDEPTSTEAIALMNLAYAKIELGQFDSAQNYIDSADYTITRKKITGLQSDLLVVKGYYHVEINKISQGLGYYFRALAICTDKKKKGALYNNIGIAFRFEKDYDNALKYYDLGYQLGKEINDTTRMVKCLTNTGSVWYNKLNYEKARTYYQQSFDLCALQHDSAQMQISLSNLAMIYESEKKYEKALELRESILHNRFTQNNPNNLLVELINIGNLKRKMKRDQEAIVYFEKALVLSDSLKNKFYMYGMCLSLSRYYAGFGDYKKAYEYRLKAVELNDSLVQQNTRKNAQEVEAKFQNKEKEKEIVLLQEKNKVSNLQKANAELGLKQKNTTLGFSIAIAIFILLLALLLWYRNSQERKHSKQLSVMLDEKDVLLQEIHHRVKNNLQLVSSLLSLQSHSIQQEETSLLLKTSQDRIHSLALLHEKLYQSKHLKQINFQEYVHELATNLADSFNCEARRIQIQISSDPIQTDIDQLVPCGLILNELITNSVKYAFPQSSSGTITIQAQEVDGSCVLRVSDNGRGFDGPMKADGVGLKLVRGLVRQLKGKLSQVFPETGGVQFVITFPLQFYKASSNV